MQDNTSWFSSSEGKIREGVHYDQPADGTVGGGWAESTDFDPCGCAGRSKPAKPTGTSTSAEPESEGVDLLGHLGQYADETGLSDRIAQTFRNTGEAVYGLVQQQVVRPIAMPFEAVMGGLRHGVQHALVGALPDVCAGLEILLRVELENRIHAMQHDDEIGRRELDPNSQIPPNLARLLNVDVKTPRVRGERIFTELHVDFPMIRKAIPDKAPDEISGEVTSLAMIADMTVTVDILPGDLELFVNGRPDAMCGAGRLVPSVHLRPERLKLVAEGVSVKWNLDLGVMSVAFDAPTPPRLEFEHNLALCGCLVPQGCVDLLVEMVVLRKLREFTRARPLRVPAQAPFALKLAVQPIDPYALSTMNGQVKQSIGVLQSWTTTDAHAADQQLKLYLMRRAKGLAMLTQISGGIGVGGGYGSGIIVRRLDKGGWSAPVSIATWSLGFGIQFGTRKTDKLVVLMSDAQIEAFMGSHALTIGAVAAAAGGPLGRDFSLAAKFGQSGTLTKSNQAPAESWDPEATGKVAKAANAPGVREDVEGDLGDLAHASAATSSAGPWLDFAKLYNELPGTSASFSFSHAQGWYVGASAVGELVHERSEDNEEYYGIEGVSAQDILLGLVPRPRGGVAEELYKMLDSLAAEHLELGGKLRDAAWNGKMDLIQELVDEGADINARDAIRSGPRQGWTPLMCAARQKRAEAVKALLDLGADVNLGDVATGETPLALARWREGAGAFLDTVRGATLDEAASEQIVTMLEAAGGIEQAEVQADQVDAEPGSFWKAGVGQAAPAGAPKGGGGGAKELV
jgi:lipid-binding SYLF domain-containing protein